MELVRTVENHLFRFLGQVEKDALEYWGSESTRRGSEIDRVDEYVTCYIIHYTYILHILCNICTSNSTRRGPELDSVDIEGRRTVRKGILVRRIGRLLFAFKIEMR